MKTKLKTRVLSVVLAVAIFVTLFPVFHVSAADTIYEIKDFNTLVNAANMSRNEDYSSITYILTNDIVITENDLATLTASDGYKHITFGSSDCPFSGVFDGNGYTISGLRYDGETFNPEPDTGLFANAKNAAIRNLIIDDADLDSDYRGGIVVGYAENTLLENITVKNSHAFIATSNNALTIVTDGGVVGGAIVGEARNSILYNCESVNTMVNTNTTSGVDVLSGKGIYLGALVGSAYATTIEYSRAKGGLVKAYHDVAIDALGGNTLYVGGIAGELKNGSRVIDCFSTAELNFYCATYVAIGAGNTGHIGGIAAAAYGDQCEIKRCHYAGEMTSRQYNAVLIFPVIQDNVNMSGIIDIWENGTVINSYFKGSIANTSNVLGNSSTTSQYGPQSDERYANSDFWISHEYDLIGNKTRSSDYSDNHINKWVMDYINGYPIHGESVTATLNFKDAGKVIFSPTKLIQGETYTANPYNFAVQGIDFNEKTISLKAETNTGYRFIEWYKVPDTNILSLPEEYTYFKNIFKDDTYKYSDSAILSEIPCENNDLFIAKYQAQVIFHDIDGNIIDPNTGISKDNSNDDWYDGGSVLPNVIPDTKPKSDTAALIGWTTVKSSEQGGGYSAISLDTLKEITSSGEFYISDDLITKAMNLYPVYTDLITNINTVFEGNEQDSVNNSSLRSGVGKTFVASNENNEVVLNVVAEDGTVNFPDGYRFLGWYDENNGCISTETCATLSDIDLTTVHTFTARFEYRVDYYSENKNDVIETIDNIPYANVWHKYQETFKYLDDAPVDGEDTFYHWANVKNEKSCSDCANRIATDYQITGPKVVYAHITGSSIYDILVAGDFPGASHISDENSPAGTKYTVNCVPNDGYQFVFWACETTNGNTWTSEDSSWKAGMHTATRKYYYKAHLVANVNFFSKLNNDVTTVTRRYNELILHSGKTNAYTYPISGDAIGYTTVSAASPTNEEMKIDGYYFIGWINGTDIGVGSDEWNYIYDRHSEDPYCTSDINKVLPYIVTDTDITTETMDLYPVYAAYHVSVTTNIAQLDMPNGINTPKDPVCTYTINPDGTASVSLTMDTNTHVSNNSDALYELVSVTVQKDNGKIETITPDSNGNVSSTITYDISAGPNYKFIAYYEPFAVLYHLDNSDVQVDVYEYSKTIKDIPLPTYNISQQIDNGTDKKHLFIGWTQESSQDGYHRLDTMEEANSISLIKEGMPVLNSIELWPVYLAISTTINSNIDSELTDQNIKHDTVRYIERENDKAFLLVAEEIEGHDFVGWYTNYINISEPGNKVSNNQAYILEGDENFNPVTYTAVYRKIYNIYYHNVNGDVLYAASVFQDEERTFVKDNITEQNIYNRLAPAGLSSETPIDAEAFITIQGSLPSDMKFITWNWVNNGNVEEWNTFKNKTVQSIMADNDILEMHLYPMVRQVSVFDSTELKLNLISDNDAEPDLYLTSESDSLSLYFNYKYKQPEITVSVENISFGPNGIINSTPISDVNIILYSDTSISKELIGTGITGDDGRTTFKVSYMETVTVRIPKTIILNSSGVGNYSIGVKGKITDAQTVEIKPESEFFTLSETFIDENAIDAKDNILATVSLSDTTWNNADDFNDVDIDTFVFHDGSITASNPSAGSWKGSVYFDISIKNKL